MLPISSCNYFLEGVSEDLFWRELNKITVKKGGELDLGYIGPTLEKSEKIFCGRRISNKFSLYLNHKWSALPWSQIIAKGEVSKKGSGLMISCQFTYPILSLIMIITFGSLIYSELFPITIASSLTFGFVVIALFVLVIRYNHLKIKHEMVKQLETIEQKTKIESTKLRFL